MSRAQTATRSITRLEIDASGAAQVAYWRRGDVAIDPERPTRTASLRLRAPAECAA